MFMKSGFVLLAALLGLLFVTGCAPGGAQSEATPPPAEETATVAPQPTDQPTESAPTAAPTQPATTATEPTETVPVPDATSLDAFIGSLQAAVAARDFAALQGLMADPFSVGYWLSEGVSYAPAEAAAFLESAMLPEGAQIVWADPEMDLAPLLQGQPPATFLGPDKEVAAALLSYGWGENGDAEAIQFISRQTDGSYRWELLLYSAFGFLGLPTDVAAVVVNADEATFYAGPGTEYEPVATVFGGQTYPVIGVSQDQQWWRLRCYDDANAPIPQCWVSADPAITSPSTLP